MHKKYEEMSCFGNTPHVGFLIFTLSACTTGKVIGCVVIIVVVVVVIFVIVVDKKNHQIWRSRHLSEL